jgi:chaperonin GroEL (HSP60 family)
MSVSQRMWILCLAVLAALPLHAADDLASQMLSIKRVYVDRLTGGETAAQMRDLIISSLQNSKLFILTENPDRADATIRGAAEDLIYTDSFESSDSVDIRGGGSMSTRPERITTAAGSTNGAGSAHSVNLGAGDHESDNIKERKHEALATVRLVNKDGDVIWSTTQESNGAKFHGASADVAEKIAHQLSAEYERLAKAKP